MAALDGDTGRVLTLIARLDLALDILGALRADMRTMIPAGLGDGKDWEEALKDAQMSVGKSYTPWRARPCKRAICPGRIGENRVDD